jgi:hypothetical protein
MAMDDNEVGVTTPNVKNRTVRLWPNDNHACNLSANTILRVTRRNA